MKNAPLFLALLVGLFSGHADSGEKNIIVPAAAEIPDRCWCEYNVTNSKVPEENTSYEMEKVSPLRSDMERGEPDFIPASVLSALSYDGLDAFSNKKLINEAGVYSIPLLPIWKPVVDANTCDHCGADTNDLVGDGFNTRRKP